LLIGRQADEFQAAAQFVVVPHHRSRTESTGIRKLYLNPHQFTWQEFSRQHRANSPRT
jgi:hypothetical protein